MCRWCAARPPPVPAPHRRSGMMPHDPTAQIAALGIEPNYSARQAAVLLGRSYSWLDQRLRRGQFVLPDGAPVQPLGTAGGYRRFTTAMLRDIATSSYRQHWFSMEKLKSAFRQWPWSPTATPASTRSRTDCLHAG